MENEELVQQIQAGINVASNLEQLYLQNRSFIFQIAKKYSAAVDLDDLMQEGYLGLYEAVKHYQPDKGNLFLTYAGSCISRFIQRYCHNCGSTKRIPEYMISRISKYRKYISEQKAAGVEPSDFTICRDLQLTEQQLKNMRKAIYESECISTTDLVPGTDNMAVEDSLADPLDMEAEVLDSIAREQAEYLIWKIVDELNERQAKVIVGRYKENNTLNEIAKKLNLSNDRISQIEKQALLLLRDKEELTHIAEIYGYMNPYKGTGYNSFKYHGSAVENEAIRNIEKEERLSELERKIKEKKAEIQKSLNIDELFSNVLNFASQ